MKKNREYDNQRQNYKEFFKDPKELTVDDILSKFGEELLK